MAYGLDDVDDQSLPIRFDTTVVLGGVPRVFRMEMVPSMRSERAEAVAVTATALLARAVSWYAGAAGPEG